MQPSDMDKLVELGQRAEVLRDWPAFAHFALLKRRGLRRQAMHRLDDFLTQTKDWTFEARYAFAIWACAESRQCRGMLANPLVQQLLVPTLKEKIERRPDDPEPHRGSAFWAPAIGSTISRLR